MKRIVFLSVCLLFPQTFLYSAELAKEGKTGWKIVLPDEATIVEKTAARELAEHLKLVTGADFATIGEKDTPAGEKSLIFVGHTAKAPEKDYKFDEILIRMDGGNLILAGDKRRGALYAVYSFLQDVVGVRWWTADATFVPKRPTLVVADDLNISYAPQMISREIVSSRCPAGCFFRTHEGERGGDAGIRRRGCGSSISSIRSTRTSRRKSTSPPIPTGTRRSTASANTITRSFA